MKHFLALALALALRSTAASKHSAFMQRVGRLEMEAKARGLRGTDMHEHVVTTVVGIDTLEAHRMESSRRRLNSVGTTTRTGFAICDSAEHACFMGYAQTAIVRCLYGVDCTVLDGKSAEFPVARVGLVNDDENAADFEGVGTGSAMLTMMYDSNDSNDPLEINANGFVGFEMLYTMAYEESTDPDNMGFSPLHTKNAFFWETSENPADNAHVICQKGNNLAGSQNCGTLSPAAAATKLGIDTPPSFMYSTPYTMCMYPTVANPTTTDDYEIDGNSLTSGYLSTLRLCSGVGGGVGGGRKRCTEDSQCPGARTCTADFAFPGLCTQGTEGERLWITFSAALAGDTAAPDDNNPEDNDAPDTGEGTPTARDFLSHDFGEGFQLTAVLAESDITLDGFALSPRRVITGVTIDFNTIAYFSNNLAAIASMFNGLPSATHTAQAADFRFGVAGRLVSNNMEEPEATASGFKVPVSGGDQFFHVRTAAEECEYTHASQTAAPECCDMDGTCTDGDDDYCCDDVFYCSNDGVDYAESRGGISCPDTIGMPCPVLVDCTDAFIVPTAESPADWLEGYATEVDFSLDASKVDEDYCGSTESTFFTLGLSGAGLADKIPSATFYIGLEQASIAALQAVSDEGVLLRSRMEFIAWCEDADGDGADDSCAALAIEANAAAAFSGNNAAAGIELNVALNQITKQSGAPPMVTSDALYAEAAVAAAASTDALDFGAAGAATSNRLLFAPFGMVGYCEATGAEDGFDIETPDFPYAVVFYDGSSITCTAADVCTDTNATSPVDWVQASGCVKKIAGTSGLTYDDFEDDSECAEVLYASAQAGTGDCPAFLLGMYTVSRSMSVLGNSMDPFSAEAVMHARPQQLQQFTDLTCGSGETKRFAMAAFVGMAAETGITAAAVTATDTGAEVSTMQSAVSFSSDAATFEFKTTVDVKTVTCSNGCTNAMSATTCAADNGCTWTDNSASGLANTCARSSAAVNAVANCEAVDVSTAQGSCTPTNGCVYGNHASKGIRNKATDFADFMVHTGESQADADSTSAALKTDLGVAELFVVVAAVENLDLATDLPNGCDEVSWDPTMGQAQLEEDITTGAVAQSSETTTSNVAGTAVCTQSDSAAIAGSACECGVTASCVVGKFCWVTGGRTCNDAAYVPPVTDTGTDSENNGDTVANTADELKAPASATAPDVASALGVLALLCALLQ